MRRSTFSTRRPGSRSCRLLPDFDIGGLDPDWERMRKFLGSAQATAEEKRQFEPVNDRVCEAMLNLPDEAMFTIGSISRSK